MKEIRRGYERKDEKEFIESIDILKTASEEIQFLIDRNYPLSNAVEFVGNHHLLSKRQRNGLSRSLDSTEKIEARKSKEIKDPENRFFYMDGFNTLITLEVYYSNSLILLGKDGCYRDLAGLRGNYRICDKTIIAMERMMDELKDMKIKGVLIYLDAPVSNSGNLAALFREMGKDLPLIVELVPVADPLLYNKENVITSDSVILDRCKSWFNFNGRIIRKTGENFIVKIR